jgi:hypothetical protein
MKTKIHCHEVGIGTPVHKYYRGVVINKSAIMDDNIQGQLLLAKMQLESGKIDSIVVNGYVFNKRSFLTKSGRFNQSKYCNIMPWAYEKDFMIELSNLIISENNGN